jgi:hypothetical protein
MRLIRTIILRLLVDNEQPQSLRGVLQAVGDSEQHTFTDEQSMVEQVRQLCRVGSAAGRVDHSEESSIIRS